MTEFVLALALFLLSHSIPARPAVRGRLTRLFGERAYLILYSLLSIGLLVWLISAAARAPFVPLWDLELWQYWVPILAMPLALFLFIAGAISPNPLSIGFSRARYDPTRPGIVSLTRHPIPWSFAFWALAHLAPNGDLVSLIMFGGFGVFALLGMTLIDRRRNRQMREEWTRLSAGTALLPFGSGRLAWDRRMTIAFGGAILAYALLLWLHPLLLGPDPTIVFS